MSRRPWPAPWKGGSRSMCRWAGWSATSGTSMRSGWCSSAVMLSAGVVAGSLGSGYRSATAGSHSRRNRSTNAAVSAVPSTYPTAVPASSRTKASSGSSST
ncbi:hypothetical protein BJF78_05285 [Pseudonocardia sp. CNS-139]|nr:hypothetical protein BJF78_05285 [Pseudonocardia sp. CNS-139]